MLFKRTRSCQTNSRKCSWLPHMLVLWVLFGEFRASGVKKKWIFYWNWWARASYSSTQSTPSFHLVTVVASVLFIYPTTTGTWSERRLGQPDISFALFISASAGFSAHNFFILITCCAKGAFCSTDLMELPCATNLSKSHAVLVSLKYIQSSLTAQNVCLHTTTILLALPSWFF